MKITTVGFVAIDTGAAQSRDKLAAAGVPVFGDIGRAMQALASLCRWLAQAPATERWAALRKAIITAASCTEALPPRSRTPDQAAAGPPWCGAGARARGG